MLKFILKNLRLKFKLGCGFPHIISSTTPSTLMNKKKLKSLLYCIVFVHKLFWVVLKNFNKVLMVSDSTIMFKLKQFFWLGAICFGLVYFVIFYLF